MWDIQECIVLLKGTEEGEGEGREREEENEKVKEKEEEEEAKGKKGRGRGGKEGGEKQLPVCAWQVSPSHRAGCAGAGWWCHSLSASAAVPHAALTGGVHLTVEGEESNKHKSFHSQISALKCTLQTVQGQLDGSTSCDCCARSSFLRDLLLVSNSTSLSRRRSFWSFTSIACIEEKRRS